MTPKRLPLHQIYERSGAQFTEKFGSLIPERYSSTIQEYQACKNAVGIIDRSYWGKIKVSGKDSLDLLHRLSTNDVASLHPEMVTPTVLTNEKGRIVDYIALYCQRDFLLLLASPQNVEKVVRWIQKFIIMEEVTVEDVTDSYGLITLIGPRAHGLVENTFRHSCLELEQHRYYHLRLNDISDLVSLAIAHEVGKIGVNILSDTSTLSTLWNRLLENGKNLNALPIGWEAFDALRIEMGIPLFGKELTEEINPLEANLIDAISFTKGCYVGQEVIARLDTYDKVQKRLCHITLDRLVQWAPDRRAEVFSSGQKIGWVTSLAVSPSTGMPIGLAYVRTKSIRSELEISVRANGSEARGRVQVPANLE